MKYRVVEDAELYMGNPWQRLEVLHGSEWKFVTSGFAENIAKRVQRMKDGIPETKVVEEFDAPEEVQHHGR